MSSQTRAKVKMTPIPPLNEAPIESDLERRLGYDDIEAVALDRWANEGGR